VSFNSFGVVGVIIVLASVSLLLVFSQNNISGLAEFSVERCTIPDGFEDSFASKNKCIDAARDLCAQVCASNNRYDCFYNAKRLCENLGRTQVRFFR